MTEEEITIVKKTWKIFRGINPSIVGDTFYSKLFSDTPALRKMFPSDMQSQYKKLIDMVSVIVSRLDTIGEINDEIKQMGMRHQQYGVRYKHYSLVGNALLWTLEQGLGNEWTPTVKNAWEKCYKTIVGTMTAVYKR
jgi:hemoglobin-like flavoprotein